MIWQRFLRFDPQQPIWPNRDRFVLSNGHASMLLYSMLHLTGVRAVDPDYEVVGEPSVSLDDIKRFRQLDSKCPGHPEYRWTSGVESTTGPLGQGVATSVGMAVASKWLAARYNAPGFEIFDFDVYTFCGDGDLEEGVSNEAASLAGHQQLDNLCWVYDNNHISIDGPTELTFTDDVAARFAGYGWNVTRVGDANDLDLITRALEVFRKEQERPTLIVLDSHIGWGSPHKVDTAEAHGEPLGEEEVRETKRAYGWPEDAQFLVPDGVREHFDEGVGRRGAELRQEWEDLLESYTARARVARRTRSAPCSAASFPRAGTPTSRASSRTRRGWPRARPRTRSRTRSPAGFPGYSRDRPISPARPRSDSRTSRGPRTSSLTSRHGRQLHLGIREHESAALSNGLSLSKLRPLWSTYLTFSDYAKPAIRLSALMELPVIHLFTHDSIGLGEDGPTHQPVEHLAGLRAIPGLDVIRPADANEVSEAWRAALDRHHQPVALVLTRQDVPIIDRSRYASAEGLRRGRLRARRPRERRSRVVILIATGSEVALAIAAHEKLICRGVPSRVVSLPCWELFDRQDQSYRDEVLPPEITGSRLDRGGIYPGLGAVRRFRGSDDRDAHLRFLRTPEGRTEQVRVHPRRGGRDSQGGTWTMKPTQQLHELGQSLWLDNITRTMLDDGTLSRATSTSYDVTGQTSNPTIFDKAISSAATPMTSRSPSCASRASTGRSSSSSWPLPT